MMAASKMMAKTVPLGAFSVMAVLLTVCVLSVVTLRTGSAAIAERRAGIRAVAGYVRDGKGEVVYVTHWFWNTAVGFFNGFEDDYFPHGYDPYHAVNLSLADADSKNRYVQSLAPGETMDAGILVHDLFLFEASRGAEMSYGVGRGEIPAAMSDIPESWRLAQTIPMAENRVVDVYRITPGQRWLSDKQ
jgi:hypothetical protein